MKLKSEPCPYTESLRSFICCDACGAPNPPSRCATCNMTYYCHEACAKNHWQVHKAYCKSPKDILQQSNLVLPADWKTENLRVSISEPSASDAKESPSEKTTCDMCNIESDSPLYNYKTRESDAVCCERLFCLSCTNHYEKISTSLMTTSSKANPKCPCCRCEEAKAENDENATNTENSKFQFLQAALWTARAASASSLIESSDDKFRRQPHQHPLLVKYANTALDFVEILLDQDAGNTAAKILQGRILGLIGAQDLGLTLLKEAVQKLSSASSSSSSSVPAEQKKRVDELMEQVKEHMARAEMEQAEALLEEIQNMRDQKFVLFVQPHDIVDLRLTIARLELQDGNYKACRTVLKEIMTFGSASEGSSSSSLTPDQLLHTYLLFAKCFIEMQEYDKAIEASNLAIDMNRHYPRVYKELVKAHYGKGGDSELAKSAASRAILYESPWDDQTKQRNQQLYKDLFGNPINDTES